MNIVKKFLATALLSCACVLFAKEKADASHQNSANRDYVKAAASLEQAFVSFEKTDFVGAVNQAREAENLVSGILKNYPESDIALKIVTDPNLRIGLCKFADFKNKIIADFEKFANKRVMPFDIAWAISIGSQDESIIEFFATYLAYANYQKTTLEQSSGFKVLTKFDNLEILDEVCRHIKNPQSRQRIAQAVSRAALLEKSIAKAAKNFAAPEPPKPAKMPFTDKQIKEFEKVANSSGFALDAPEKMLALSATFAINAQQLEQLNAPLNKAFENSSRISVQRMKNKAMFEMAGVFTNFNMLEDAMKCIYEISDDKKLTSQALSAIALKNVENGNIAEALKLSALIKDSMLEDKILFLASSKKLEQKDFDAALKYAVKIKNRTLKDNASLLLIAANHKADKEYQINFDEKAASNEFSEDLFYSANSDILIQFCRNAGIAYNAAFETEAERKLSLLISILKSLKGVSNDDKIEFLHDHILAELPKIKAQKNRSNSAIAFDVISQAIIFGMDNDEIMSAVQALLLDFSVEENFYKLADCGTLATISKNLDLAYFFFERASQACFDKSAKDRNAKILYLAWQMQFCGFDRTKTAEIIKPFLPNLKN